MPHVTSVKFESEVFSDGCGVQFSNLEDETFFIGKNDVFKEGGNLYCAPGTL
jgi:hypothetical protein